MSAVKTKKKKPVKIGSLDRQITEAKTVLRQLRDSLEDLEDRRELAGAKERNAGKPGSDWKTVKKEFEFDF